MFKSAALQDDTAAGPQTVQDDRILIMANPTSGGYRPSVLDEVRKRLSAGGKDVCLRLTRHAGEIGEVCADPSFDAGVLVIAGGDGSINEALAGLQFRKAPPKIAVIPSGTANVLALELKLPKKAKAIADAILEGRTQPLHAGLANDHPFVLMASAGFDAEVVHGIPLALKRRLGKLAYVLTAIKIGLSRQTSNLQLTVDGNVLHGKLAVATNGRLYGGPFEVAPEASVTREGLQLLVLEKDDPLSSMRFGLALLLGRVHRARGVRLVPFQEAVFGSDRPVAVQIDGDPFGVTPVTVRSSTGHLEIIVPH
ncbi:diacylglycerol kinase family lipid kinase [Roseibium hamelinense]|nr:diacylglycerol kinase family protein [Roseibium hamelinense]MTI42935.1 diacylglycerol kinase family lipid kinase [Roseibium hamelinense]